AGVEGSGFLGLPILDLNMAVDGGEFLRFDFNKAVNLTGFHLWDMPFGSNQLSINGKTFSTGGTGPFASLGAVTSLTFRSISDDFRVKSLTVTSAVPAIPEPSTHALMLLGLAGVAAVASRKKA
ncbi:MAG: PEP-CTERM sorting domain-containing protein, partial [Aquabacterium sp.]